MNIIVVVNDINVDTDTKVLILSSYNAVATFRYGINSNPQVIMILFRFLIRQTR